MKVEPGFRDVPNEPIRFGTDLRDFVQCKCGNEIHSGYEYALEREVYTWVDASMNTTDESTVYGVDCRRDCRSACMKERDASAKSGTAWSM